MTENADIRSWADANGLDCPARGRIPAEIREAYAAAQAVDEKKPDMRIAASRAKVFASEMAFRATDRALQIHGAAGFSCDYPIERMFRDSRAFRIGEGTSEMQRIQIARHVLG